MGVFSRPDSPYWWIYLERQKIRERTDFKIGDTVAQRKDSRRLASDLYHQRMNESAARLYKLPSAAPAIRFAKYADAYATTINLRRGAERERELVKPLVRFLGEDLLTLIDQDRVKEYMAWRVAQVSPRTVNREVGLLKSMLRDAAPKYLPISPLVGMPYLRTTKPRRRLMTHEEEAQILKHADAAETALLVLGIDGLIRLTDLLDLRTQDLEGDWLHVMDPKGGDPYKVALSARAQAALAALAPTIDGPYFFQVYRGAETERDRRSRVRRVIKKLCKKAGVAYGKKLGGITFHWATRKTGATRLVLEQKTPIPIVQRQGDWKTSDVLMSIYAEADDAAQLAAFAGERNKTESA